ncbi:AAA family ATPase [Kribbella sp. NPDC051952]|uniref:AAA family ATPase n=1 Tax=Kribbella sp. NPDC051952 TaxID=3154851 RepID=UPI00342DA3A0
MNKDRPVGANGDQSQGALLITGSVGVGKTSVAEAVGELLAGAAIPHAVIDLDWLACYWPSPTDDPFNFDLQLRNLRSMARNYLDAGAERLVLAGVVESREDRERYAGAIGVDVAVCRLSADLEVIRQRLIQRHGTEERRRPPMAPAPRAGTRADPRSRRGGGLHGDHRSPGGRRSKDRGHRGRLAVNPHRPDRQALSVVRPGERRSAPAALVARI